MAPTILTKNRKQRKKKMSKSSKSIHRKQRRRKKKVKKNKTRKKNHDHHKMCFGIRCQLDVMRYYTHLVIFDMVLVERDQKKRTFSDHFS